MCHECVTRNHQPSFNPLFKHDKNSKHKLWAGCVKYKIRNEITIQCVSQYFWSSPRISISLCSCQSNREIWTKVVNFTPKFAGKLPGSLRRKFTLFGNTVGLVIIFKMNPFTVQGKAIPSSVRENIIESWLRGKGPTQIGKELRVQKQIIQGHPTTIFGKISVRKTIWDLEFSEHLL